MDGRWVGAAVSVPSIDVDGPGAELTGHLTPHVPVLLVDLLVLGLVGRAHVPVEAVLQARRVRLVVDLLELHGLARERAVRLYEVGLGLGHEPVWKSGRHVGVLAVEQVEDDAHGDAELLEVEVAVVVDVGQVPHALQLVVPQPAVLEHGRRLLACQVFAAICPGREDVPVRLDLLCLDARRHVASAYA